MLPAWWPKDGRYFQIAALSTLLAFSLGFLDLGARVWPSALAIVGALATQAACSRLWRLASIDLRSPLITGLSLSLLLRADEPWLHAAAAIIAIASKFVLRLDGKHVWNPAGLAIVALLFGTDHVWISPGQWGASLWFASLLAFLAILVLQAARRGDVALFFLGCHAALLFARALWLGDPLAIPLHQLESGSLLIFSFFMISDPRTTPDARLARFLFALGVALFAHYLAFFMQMRPALYVALVALSPVNPLLDRIFRAERFQWSAPHKKGSFAMRLSRRLTAVVAAVAIIAQLTAPASAFCGFYVAKADAKLFNKASKVVLAWEDGKTAVTMASDYEGDPKEFAVVVPVPTFIQRKQIGIVEMKTVDHLDAFTAPRLVEYSDPDPCAVRDLDRMASSRSMTAPSMQPLKSETRGGGVTLEASYEVGEYDVQILAASESDGLTEYLTDNGYKIPAGADDVLASYIKQKMHFFIAKVSLDRMELMGHRFLRPLQVRYETKKFMLPLRLGTVNANGPQDLIVFALTHKGRIETTNYRTVKLPTGMNVPLYVKEEFGNFYTSMFDHAVAREDMRAVFLEYAWDMGWCDPCAAEPLQNKELVELGARWIDSDDERPFRGGGSNAYVTRLHVRYDAQHFPEDLAFMETRDRDNFQGRYVLRHPWIGEASCRAGADYRRSLPARFAQEANTLVRLTGWKMDEVVARMELTGQPFRR